MNAYKHYSFDLWMTLIKSNPVYKQERVKFFYNNFNHIGKTLGQVAAIFRKIDVMCNAVNEKTGGSIAAEEMYLMVIIEMNNDSNAFDNVNLAALYHEMEQLFFRHLPMVYCENTAGALSSIKQREGITLSILSNTAFIKGHTLRRVLKMIELEKYFDFQLYSDEAGFSKPDGRIFRLMLNAVASARNETVFKPDEIVHIGDNVAADIVGARAVGINGILINSNNASITSLLN